MRKIIIIILALVVALSAVPITFACFNGGWGYWQPHKPIVYCPPNCNVAFSWVQASDNENTFTPPKEVAQTTACIKDCGKKIIITINNAYPGYEGIVDFCVKNTGGLAATITGITVNNPYPDFVQVALTGQLGVGTVISPCKVKCGHLVVYGIPQRDDAENRTFTLTITINYECTCVPKGGH